MFKHSVTVAAGETSWHARCVCGWSGFVRDRRELAVQDQRRHRREKAQLERQLSPATSTGLRCVVHGCDDQGGDWHGEWCAMHANLAIEHLAAEDSRDWGSHLDARVRKDCPSCNREEPEVASGSPQGVTCAAETVPVVTTRPTPSPAPVRDKAPVTALEARQEQLRSFGLTDADFAGWTLEGLAEGVFEAAAYHDVDLGQWMRMHPDDPDAVWQAWADSEDADGRPLE